MSLWQRFIDWLDHYHEYECYGPDHRIKLSKERWYWHFHRCWCGATRSELTNDCNLPEAEDALIQRHNR